jgi:hypothetical protein
MSATLRPYQALTGRRRTNDCVERALGGRRLVNVGLRLGRGLVTSALVKDHVKFESKTETTIHDSGITLHVTTKTMTAARKKWVY